MIHIIFFGPPGSGKGTQANYISEKFKFFHLSTGEMFRKHVIEQTLLGNIVQTYMSKGLLVPDEVTTNMFKEELNKHNNIKGLIYDGYPRTLNQAKNLDEILKKKFLEKINLSIFFSIKDEILIKRLSKRSKISGRLDDSSILIIQNRITEYHKKTKPISDFYKEKKCLITIKAEGSIYQVKKRLENVILKKLK